MTEEREPLLVSSDRAGRPSSSRRRTVRSDSPLSEDLQFGRRASRMKHFVKNTCANCWTVENVKNKFPITKWLPRYRLYDLQSDVIAGLTVALTVIPQGLAYANIANLDSQYGLYSAFMGCFVYCLFGTSKDITLGPTAIMSLMTATFAASPKDKDPTYAIILALACGVVQFLMGFFHLGILVNFISYPVINAFTSAAAITIACGQVKGILGLHKIPRDFLEMVYETCKHIPETNVWDLVMGLCCLVILFFLKKLRGIKWKEDPLGREPSIAQSILRKAVWLTGINIKQTCLGQGLGVTITARKRPSKLMHVNHEGLRSYAAWSSKLLSANAIIVIVGAVIAAVLLHYDVDKLTITGDIKSGLPPFKLPAFTLDYTEKNGTESIHKSFGNILGDIGPGLGIVPLLGLVEAIAIGKAFARQNNYKILPNQELIAIGVANIASCFVSSYPVTGSFSRTAVNSQSGVRTPASGIFTGGVVILALQVLTPLCKYIPKSALSAVIISAVLQMVDYQIVKKLWRVRKIDLVPMFFTFVASFVIGIEYGILIGIGISLLILLYPIARPNMTVDYHDTIVVQFDQGIGYPAIEYVQSKIEQEMNGGEKPRSVILDCSHVSGLDYTTIQGIIELVADFMRNDVNFALACVSPHLKKMLDKAEVPHLICGKTVEETMKLIEKARETDDELRSITSVNGTVKVHVPTKESEAVNGGAIGEHL